MEVYSIDGERYYNLDEMDDIIHSEEVNIDNSQIYKANKKEYKHKDFINVAYLIECMQDSAYDIADEYAESYLYDLSKDKLVELEKNISDWLDINAETPKFFSVENEVKISIDDFINNDEMV